MGVSFLAKPKLIADRYYSKVPGVEFRAFFKQNDPDSVWFASCLRMNATFPFVLPLVALPSQPEIKVVDAGAMDNFGIITAVKYLYQFHDWFAENTEEIIFVTIRDSEKEDEVQDYDEANILSKIMSPLGGAVTGFKVMGDFANDYLLENVQHWYRGNIRVVSYEYPLHSLPNPASMSFHLTELEKKTIPIALSYPHNEVQTEVLRNIFKKK
jgi:hypothetical protein